MKAPTSALTSLILFLSMISAVAIDIYLPALPTIAEELEVPANVIQQSLTTYFVGFCIGMLIFGPLSDFWGHRRLILIGLVVFTLATMLCAIANDAGYFRWFRFLQSIGGGAIFVVSRALVGHLWGTNEIGRMMSLVMGVGWIGPIVAPIVGAELLSFFGWQSIFVLLSVMGFLSLVLSIRMIPIAEKIQSDKGEKNILTESVLSYKWVFTDLQSRNLILCSSFVAAAYFAYLSGSSFILIEYYDLSARQFSIAFAVIALGMVVSSFTNRALLKGMPAHKIYVASSYIATAVVSILFFLSITGTGVAMFNTFVFLSLFFHIPIQANCAAMLVVRAGNNIASSIALLLTFTFGLGAISSFLVGWLSSLLGSTGPIAATGVMFVCTVIAAFFMLRTISSIGSSKKTTVTTG